MVEGAVEEGESVLIMPLLLSYGGIEDGIRQRLEGLPYRMARQALLPDERLFQWVLMQGVSDNPANGCRLEMRTCRTGRGR